MLYDEGWQTFSVEFVNPLGFLSHIDSITTTLLCHDSLKSVINKVKMGLCSKKTLLSKISVKFGLAHEP